MREGWREMRQSSWLWNGCSRRDGTGLEGEIGRIVLTARDAEFPIWLAIERDQLGCHDLGGAVLLAILAFPRPIRDAARNEDQPSLREIFAGELGEFQAA